MAASELAIRAIAAPPRREILRLVRRRELTAGEIVSHFDMTWPAVSQHLKVLREAGLLRERREGTKRLYSLHSAGVDELRDSLAWLWDTSLGRLRDVVEADYRKTRKARRAPSR